MRSWITSPIPTEAAPEDVIQSKLSFLWTRGLKEPGVPVVLCNQFTETNGVTAEQQFSQPVGTDIQKGQTFLSFFFIFSHFCSEAFPPAACLRAGSTAAEEKRSTSSPAGPGRMWSLLHLCKIQVSATLQLLRSATLETVSTEIEDRHQGDALGGKVAC